MRVITLVACYRDRPAQVERLVSEALDLGPVCVMLDSDDLDAATLAAVSQPGVTLRHGRYRREREKRDALLRVALLEHEPAPSDWLLSLDPDERLNNPEALPMILEQLPGEQLFHPILRSEPDGTLWEMPSKLVSGAARRVSYLDTGVGFEGAGNWNLDPYRLGPGEVVPGWPSITHFRSARADRPEDEFYTDLPLEQAGFTDSYLEWRTAHHARFNGYLPGR